MTSGSRLRVVAPHRCAILSTPITSATENGMAKNAARQLRQTMDFLQRHPWMTFLLMGAFFLLFGFTSINLYGLLRANVALIVSYGAMALDDGALQQLAEILGAAVLSIAFFVLFALCERVLVGRLTGNLHDD
jgi:hypothetical protein